MKFAPGSGPSVPQKCPHTGAGFLMGGPFWVEPLHDPAWISAILASVKVPCRRLGAKFLAGNASFVAAHTTPDERHPLAGNAAQILYGQPLWPLSILQCRAHISSSIRRLGHCFRAS